MKIDKLGFYKSRDGDEIEIVFINKPDEVDFIAIGKLYLKGKTFLGFVTYRDEDGTHEDCGEFNLIQYLRPSGVEWPMPRKTSFVAYLHEGCTDNFDLKDPDHIVMGLMAAGKYNDKSSKWRFYGEELLGE